MPYPRHAGHHYESPRETQPPLSPNELQQAVDLSLWVGQLLLEHGADARRTEETIHRFGFALGCDWIDVLIYANGLALTTSSGGNFRTRVRQINRRPVNLSMVTAVNDLSRQAVAGLLSREEIEPALAQMSTERADIYPDWSKVLFMALACAGFSRLFGGDWPAFAITLFAALMGMAVRLFMEARQNNQLLITVISAFMAGLLAASGAALGWSQTPQVPPASAVLMLVPGVPLLNSVEDLLYGHINIGLSRGTYGAIICLGIALGLWIALFLLGILGG